MDPASERGAAGLEARRRLSRGDNVAVRAVGRLPAKVHTKLLIAFVGTAVLVVAVGVLGLRVLAQSNDRVAALGALQERAAAYGELRAIPGRFACYSRRTRIQTSTRSGRGACRAVVQHRRSPSTWRSLSALARIGPATLPDELGFVPPAEDERVLRKIRLTSSELTTVMRELVDPNRRAVLARSTATPPHSRGALGRLKQLATELANATNAKT